MLPWESLDSQPLPRGDWSGNPETFHRPHAHLGGDLRPGHPWLSMPMQRRAEMWARGYRPDPYEQMDPWIRFEYWRTGTDRPCLAPGGRCRPRTEPWYAPHYWPQAFPLPISREEEEEERVQIELAARMARGETPTGTAPIEDPKYRAEMRVTRRQLASGDGHRVGAFFYDPDLAKFGNAFSPFVDASSYEAAHLALQRPFEDRYNPRYERQTWADWMARCDYDAHDAEFVGVDPGPTCWQDPETGAFNMFPTLAAAKRAVEGHAASGFFDTASEKTGFKKNTVAAALGISGLTALFMFRNPRHALEIGAAGAAAVALSVAIDLGGRGAAFWSG